MLDAPIEAQTILHVISYLDWQREGEFTVDIQRAKVLEILAQLLESLENSSQDTLPIHNLILSSQTILLEDTTHIAGELLKALKGHANSKQVIIGPWYVQLDGLLANGEATIRNLLLGRDDVRKYGFTLNNIAFMPDNCQGAQQLPQILQGFDIDAAFFCFGHAAMPLPFNWEAPDGSQVLVTTFDGHRQIPETIEIQRTALPDGPFLWIHRIVTSEVIVASVENDNSELSIQHSSLKTFVDAAREHLPDAFRPILKGELHLQGKTHYSGRFSARLAHKQDVIRLQSKLNYLAEPLLALASNFGEVRFPIIQQSLLNYSWRLLLQNMSRDTFAGAVSDAVYDEVAIRNRQIEDNSQHVIKTAITGLSGTLHNPENATQTANEIYLVVWNPHGHSVKQMVELKLSLPNDKHPNVLLDAEGSEQAFSWDGDKNIIGFLADAPAVGYVVYTLKISRDETAVYNQKQAVAGSSIGSASGETLGLVGGRLDWTFANGNIIDLLNYHDGGDAGDIFSYQEPETDVVVNGSIVDVVQVEATPTYERLIFRNRMRIAPNLTDGKERERGLRVLDLTTTATYYNGLPGIYFKTEFTNTAEDHRLRAHIRTGIKASKIYADTAFGLIEHPLPHEGQSAGEYPIQGLVALYNNKQGFGLFTRGLISYETLIEDDQITLAVTLLRSVGWIDKQKRIKANGAQMNGDFVAEFMLMPLGSEHDAASIMQTGLAYHAPLTAFQYDEKPAQSQYSYISVDDDKVVMTALKPPQDGKGLIVRLYNPLDESIDTQVTSNNVLDKAMLVNLAEEKISDLSIEDNKVSVSLEPYKIVTLKLVF